MKVKEIMTAKSVQYCSPETKLHNAAKAMKEANIGALPVLNKEKKVVGMITDRDICLSLAHKQSKPVSKQNVGDIISSKVISVKPEDDLQTALRQMRTNKIGRLPVTDKEGKLKGILSMHNLIAQSFNGGENFGNISDTDENIAKTVKALTERYAFTSKRKPASESKSASVH